jgi:TolB protein
VVGESSEGIPGEILLLGMEVLQLNRIKIFVAGVAIAIFLGIGCSSVSLPLQPNNKKIAFSYPTLTANHQGFDDWTPVEFAAKPFSSLMQHTFCEEGGDFDPDISSDNQLMVFSSLQHSPNPDLYIKRISGHTTTRLTSDPASEIQPCFSPAGDKVAYASERSGNWDIWVIGTDGTSPVRMTTSSSNEMHPSWSPDGKSIVYCLFGERSQQWELWVLDAENPSIKKSIGFGMFPKWSPDPKNNKIAFQLNRFRGSQWFSIWTVDMVGDEARFPTEIVTSTEHACVYPSWSPDGSKIAYHTTGRNQDKNNKANSDASNNSNEDIWIVDINGNNNNRLTTGQSSNYAPTWAPDGRIFFCSDRMFVDNIWSVKTDMIDFTAPTPMRMSKHPQGSVQAN